MNDVERCISEWVDRVNERDATIAALTKELEQEKQNAFGLAAAQCDDPIPGEYGHKLCGTVMEKDRQIAALQAERDEYKTMYACLTGETYDNPIAALKDQLTQRTAELSRRTGECNEISKMYIEAQAELERVRGELAETKEVEAALSSKVVEYEVELNGDPQNFYGRGRTVGLRTLVLALPKVEGEIAVKETEIDLAVMWGITVNGLFGEHSPLFDTKEEADAYAALLQHRQGMEG